MAAECFSCKSQGLIANQEFVLATGKQCGYERQQYPIIGCPKQMFN